MTLSPSKGRCRSLGVLLALLAPLACVASGGERNLRAVVDASIRPLMTRYDIPGMAVALTVDGRSHVFNYGVADRQSGAAVTDSTIFEIGSISKMFTATLAAYAQAIGKLSLDDHPGRYLPRLQGRPIDRATLLHLGTYTAGGLPLQFPDEVRDDDAAMAYLHDWQPIGLPGTVRQYSNASIGLLGAVTSAAWNERFATLIETQLFSKFGMTHSHLQVPAEAMADYAWGDRDGRPVRVGRGPLDEPGYGVKSTAADMIRFVQANLDPSALEPALQRAVTTTQIGRFAIGAMVQGFGWEQYAYPVSRASLLQGNSKEVIFEANPVQPLQASSVAAPRLFDKTGSTNGFGAYVAFVPAKRIGLVMLANRNLPIPARVDAAHAILGGLARP